MKVQELTIAKASKLLADGKITSIELTKLYLARIKKFDPEINAFLLVNEEAALSQARESDKRRLNNEPKSRLDGIPISLKDLICQKNVKTTAGSKILSNFVPPYDATVVRKIKEAGLVILGKNNLDAFAHGSSTENSDFKVTKNPWDTSRVPGGSSGGSAAAVCSGLCLGSIGTDTGGSIRQPASLCSVVGLKPTYGRVSRYGVIAMASSLDVVGPITRTVEDAALLLEVIAGHDQLDATTLNDPIPIYSKEMDSSLKGVRIAVPKEYFTPGMDADVEEKITNAIDKFKQAGAKITEVLMPHTAYALETYYIIQPAEVSSNLSRYDGLRYGFSVFKKGSNQKLEDVYFNSRGQGFGNEAKRRIMLGTYVLSAGYYDAYYKKAMQLRTKVKMDFENIFRSADIILTPVSPTPAFKIGEKSDDPIKMYLSDIYTVPINPAGVPAISVPAGFVKRDGKDLPVGVQLIAPMRKEAGLLNIAHQFEKIRGFDLKMPKINET